MIKMISKCVVFLSVSCMSVNSLAHVNECGGRYSSTPCKAHCENEGGRGSMKLDTPYATAYYENEGGMSLKFRLSGVVSRAGQKGLPTPTVNKPVPVGRLVENGYGGDVSTTIFFNHYFGAEFSLGFNVLRTKHSTLANISTNYGVNADPGKRRDIYMVPATVTGQFHIAPFGGIRPYVGVGYHGSYLFTNSKGFKIKNGHGAVGQIGVDFYASNGTIINVDVRQFFLRPKVIYKPSLVGKDNVTSKVKLNPLVVSVGAGFTF